MIKVAYKVAENLNEYPEIVKVDLPTIVKVDISDLEGVSWKEAKKQLRAWYLSRAKELRKQSERTYFGND